MTPSTSVSPPINVICKKELSSAYHANNAASAAAAAAATSAVLNGTGGSVSSDVTMKLSPYDSIKDEMGGMTLHGASPSGYANIGSRLGQTAGGNLTPLGSNSTIMSTPSPPNTPQQANSMTYHAHHNEYFWHQYQQYPNNYNSTYYPMDYLSNQGHHQSSAANYANMTAHGGYGSANFGLSPAASLNSSMAGQSFGAQNGLDYMSPQDKYMNMNVNA